MTIFTLRLFLPSALLFAVMPPVSANSPAPRTIPAKPKATKPAPKPAVKRPVPTKPTLPVAPVVTPEIEAWGILIQVVEAISTAVTTKDLGAVHNEDMRLYSAVTVLHQQEKGLTGDREEFRNKVVELARLVGQLHIAADAGNQTESETRLQTVQAAFEALKQYPERSLLATSQARAGRYTCPMHPDVTGRKDSECPKCGMPLDQRVRLSVFALNATPSVPRTIRALVRTVEPLAVGTPAKATLTLQHLGDNKPVLLSDLKIAHTMPIHLLIVDSSLSDYHHEHPVATDIPGEYSFQFTPRKPGPYRVWADLRPSASGFQEYAITDIPAATTGDPLTNKALKLSGELDGLTCRITFEKPKLKVDEPVRGKLRITGRDGKGYTSLEPVMGAFAHLVGFNEDGKTVLHMHPSGAEVTDPNARGGPELAFILYTTQPGFYRLYAQVQIDGAMKFVPFGLTVTK